MTLVKYGNIILDAAPLNALKNVASNAGTFVGDTFAGAKKLLLDESGAIDVTELYDGMEWIFTRFTGWGPFGRGVAPNRFFGADDFASLPKSGKVDPKSIRFSQDSIAGNFKNGGSVQDLAAQLKAGKVVPSTILPIRIVVKDGKVFTLDNRRLRAFQEAGIDVPFVKLDHIPMKQLDKFSTINEGVDIIIRGSQP